MSEPNETAIVPDDPDAIVDLLSSDAEEVPVVEKEKTGEEVLDLDEDEEVEGKENKKGKETEETPETEIEVNAPPRKKELLKAYPDIFKKFKYLEGIIYRDREIAETFGSFDALKEAAGKAETLDELEGHLVQGSSVELFSQIKEKDPAAFSKVVKNLLPNLQKVDKESYVGVITDVMKRVFHEAYGQAERGNNEELSNAVKTLVGWAFPNGMGNPEREQETTRDPEQDREIAEFREERLRTAVEETIGRIDNVLKSTVEQYIDPKSEMSGYVKRNAVTDVIRKVNDEIAKDIPFRKEIQKLWDDAEKNKLSQQYKDRVKSKYIGKARGLLKKYILEVRKEVLKDSRPSQRTNSETEETPTRRTIPTGRPTPRTGGNDRLKMKPGESAAEFLARD